MPQPRDFTPVGERFETLFLSGIARVLEVPMHNPILVVTSGYAYYARLPKTSTSHLIGYIFNERGRWVAHSETRDKRRKRIRSPIFTSRAKAAQWLFNLACGVESVA